MDSWAEWAPIQWSLSHTKRMQQQKKNEYKWCIYHYNIRNTFEFHHHTWTRKVSDKNLATFVTSSRSFRCRCWVVADRASVFFPPTIAFILVQAKRPGLGWWFLYVWSASQRPSVGIAGKTFSSFCHKRTLAKNSTCHADGMAEMP